jgi:hypothetical protein
MAMKKRLQIALWLGWLVLSGALPAYANNPPAPDGMLGLIMIFPLAILAFRFAGAKLTEKQRKWRILKGLLLTLAAVAALGGGELGFLAMLILLFYGLRRGALAIQRGQGAKRFVLGGVVILFTFFAASNYLVSLSNRPGSAYWEAVFDVREIVSAEERFQSAAKLDVNKNGVGEFGSLADLARAKLINDRFVSPPAPHTYRYFVVLSGDPARDEKEFFVYATPTDYQPAELQTWGWLPGASWRATTRPRRYIDQFSFASDETKIIRQADLRGSRAVTREESRNWQEVKRF